MNNGSRAEPSTSPPHTPIQSNAPPQSLKIWVRAINSINPHQIPPTEPSPSPLPERSSRSSLQSIWAPPLPLPLLPSPVPHLRRVPPLSAPVCSRSTPLPSPSGPAAHPPNPLPLLPIPHKPQPLLTSPVPRPRHQCDLQRPGPPPPRRIPPRPRARACGRGPASSTRGYGPRRTVRKVRSAWREHLYSCDQSQIGVQLQVGSPLLFFY
jgi:hypothetical protein